MTYSYDFYSTGIMIAFISFLGFLLENIWLAFTKGYIDNRNMKFPFLFGYGLLVVAMHMLLGTPAEFAAKLPFPGITKRFSRLIYFLTVMLIVSAGEIFLGTFMEKLCGIEYWNYSWIPMHFTKYTSLPTSIGFALVITAFEEHVFVPVMDMITRIPLYVRTPAATVLLAIMAVDMLSSFLSMRRARGYNRRWRIDLRKSSHRLTIMHKGS